MDYKLYFFSNRQYWKGLLTGIRKEAYGNGRSDPTTEMPFNVIMFGFDSLSRNAWIRKLPKTYQFMTKILNADILQGYNIVGDGTPQALIPVRITDRFLFYKLYFIEHISNINFLLTASHWSYGTRAARNT